MTAEKVLSFPSFKDAIYSQGYSGIPSEALVNGFNVEPNQLKDAALQLSQLYPLMIVQNDKTFVMLDLQEVVIKPGLICDLLTLDKKI